MAELGPAAAESIWRDAAAELGAAANRISPTLIEFRLGDAVTRVSHQMTTPFTDRVSWQLMDDKPLTYRILSDAGVPIPEHIVLDPSDFSSASAFMAEAARPLVVKPARGAGGSGIVGQVRTHRQLRAALTSAGRYDDRVVVERQVEGDSYRLLLLDGRLLDVIHRSLPRLVGDGSSSIGELMLSEYERRIVSGADTAGYKPYEVDHDTLFAVENAGLRLDSVLADGESVVIKTATNFSGPEATETLHGEGGEGLAGPARRAAEALGARLAGVDVVTTDPLLPLADAGGVILEVNMPGLAHHYNVSDPARATRAAVPVLAALLGLDPDRHTGRGPVAQLTAS